MTVRAGREFLAIPGPTTMPDEVLQAMHRPALDIYSEQMVELTDSLLADLSKLFATKGQSYIYIANGHGAWEATLSNVLSRGDKLLVLESGRFAIGWGQAAAAMGVEVEVLKGDWRRAIRPAEVEARLKQDKDHSIKAIVAVQVDTASGAYNDIEAIGKAIKSTRPSGAVHGRHRGLARLHAVRDGQMGHRCRDVRLAEGPDDAAGPRLRRRQRPRPRSAQEGQPAHALLGLDRARRQLSTTANMPAPRRCICCSRCARRSTCSMPRDWRTPFCVIACSPKRCAARSAAWSEGQVLGFNIAEANERSNTVTTVTMNGFDPAALQRYCKEKCGVVLGTGIGDLSGQAFRIAHMGHVNAPMILGTLGVIEVGLNALNIPHGKGGTEAAIEYLGESVGA